MSANRRLSLWLLSIACLAPLGCAGTGRSYFENKERQAARARAAVPPKPGEPDDLADLQRELSLYSD